MLKFKAITFSLLLLLWSIQSMYAQTMQDGFVTISLNGLSAFKSPGTSWIIASDVHSDIMKPLVMESIKGTGIVINNGDENSKTNLETVNEFGDLDLEFDFMLAKNTRAGIFFQGRYKLNLNDSWSEQTPHFTDCGGIAERPDDTRSKGNKGFEGLAPSMNVCRAPGLWQHLKVVFRSPRINEKGEKISSAKFEEVYLNGTLIHEQVQLSGASGGALFKDEKSVGPVVFNSANGPLALRNIRYRMISPLNVSVTGLTFRYYNAAFKEVFPDLTKLTPASQDTLKLITGNIGRGEEVYALDISGIIDLPAQDNYTMSLLTNGMGRLYIDGQLLIERVTNRWNSRPYTGRASLAAGKHTIRVVYVKNVSDQKPALILSVKGVNTDQVDLNDKASAPARDYTDPIFLQPQGTPYLLRSFLNYGNRKLTHTISVGDPNQLNFSYDLKQGALIQLWRGDFLDVTNMWVQRGEPQLAIPRGSMVMLGDAPDVAVLSDANAAWPDSVAFDDMQNKGYTLDDKRAPTFRYLTNNIAVSDKIAAEVENASLARTVTVGNPPANFFLRMAVGSKIDLISEGVYRIDDKSYYIRIDKQYKPVIRQTHKGSELVVPFKNTNGVINYFITW